MGKERLPPELERLDALSRVRPLTDEEVRKLERAVRRAGIATVYQHWTRADDYRLLRHLLRGRKPKQIALLMHGRTERAIWRRMNILGFSVTQVEKVLLVVNGPGSGRRAKCSIAPDGETGEG